MEPKTKTTLKDIANAAGVSVALVSFVMNNMSDGKYRVSPQATERILKLAKELDYQPNNAARSLRKGRSGTIGVILSDISNPFFAEIARCLENCAYQHQHTVIFGSTDEDPAKLENLIKVFINKGVDGLIVVPCDGSQRYIERVLEANIPLVLLDRTIPSLDVNNVVLNNKKAISMALQALLDGGSRKIEMITYSWNISNFVDREASYIQSIKQAGLGSFSRIHRMKFKNVEDQIERVISDAKERGVEGIIFASNTLAIAGLKALRRNGIRVPEDMAAVCFDSSDAYELYHTTIAHIKQPIEHFGNESITLLLKAIGKKEQAKFSSIMLNPELVAGESTVRP